MPKETSPSNVSNVRFAPYVPLHNKKVNSQLDHPLLDKLVRDTVELLGGSVVDDDAAANECAVDYFVANEGSDYGEFAMRPAVLELVRDNPSEYEQFILPEAMFERMNTMLRLGLPGIKNEAIAFRDVSYPIRAKQYTPLGVGPADITDDVHVHVDVVHLKYPGGDDGDVDVWTSTRVTRHQVFQSASVYYVHTFDHSLFDACHNVNARFSARQEYESLEEAVDSLYDFLHPDVYSALSVYCSHVAIATSGDGDGEGDADNGDDAPAPVPQVCSGAEVKDDDGSMLQFVELFVKNIE